MAKCAESSMAGDQRSGQEAPSLDQAWEYFYRHTLPRRVLSSAERPSPDGKPSRQAEHAESRRAGYKELNTELYPVWTTSLADLGQFGLGKDVMLVKGRLEGY